MLVFVPNSMTTTDSVFIIFHGRFPSEKAAAIFAAKSAESFAKYGKNVTLVVPNRRGRINEDPFKYYGVDKNFKLVYLPVVDLFSYTFFKKIAFRMSFVSFAFSCFWYLCVVGKRNDIFYSNESVPLFFTSFLFSRTCYEMHDFPERSLYFHKWLFSRVRSILVHNKWKLQRLKELMGNDMKKAFYEPNAVELKTFDIDISKDEARKKLHLPLDKKIIVYTGHLYGWKGVDVLAQASALLSPNFLVVFVGGTESDIFVFTNKYGHISNIFMAGHKPYTEIPIWQKAADAVVLPNTAKENISAFYTSPMKLFEYMASNRPIIASRIPSIVEIIDDTSAFLCTADNPQALAGTIVQAIENTEEAEKRAYNAFERVKMYTWSRRAQRIFSNLENNNV